MQWILERFEEKPNNTAFIHEGRKFLYSEAVDTTKAFLANITEQGIKKGDIVALMADYSPEVFCYIIALAINGNIIIPLTRQSVIEEDFALGISGCDWRVNFSLDGRSYTTKTRKISASNELVEKLQNDERPGLILYSSGSSGVPKAILHDFVNVAEKFTKKRKSSVALAFLMLDHFGGINTILAITSSLGTVVTVKDRTVAAICSAIEKHKIQLLPATPSFLTMMVTANAQKTYNLSSLTRITYGTEVMPQRTLSKLREAFPDIALQQTYGLSEVGVLRSKSRDDGSLWMKIGGDGFETKVIDGILWIRSEFRMLGYLNAPSKFDEEGWFNTQDQVEVDGEYFKILGRESDLINVGGQKVYPTEVEDIILDLDNVLDVAVYGEGNPLLGNIVVAKIVLETPEDLAPLKKRVRQACIGKLTAYKIPSKVVTTESSLHSARFKKNRTHVGKQQNSK
jgi:acyl-CoA synthetase (AMP-forming)/AMP-acid ligase II